MPNVNQFKFSRNRSISVDMLGDGALQSVCRLTDTLNDMRVTIRVALPEMEIVSIFATVDRCADPWEKEAVSDLKELTGVRIGPGMTKIFKGLVREPTADSQILFMLEEACHGIILTSTKDMAAMVPEEQELTVADYQAMIKSNIRLYNRCAAFAPGSSLVEGIDPPG